MPYNKNTQWAYRKFLGIDGTLILHKPGYYIDKHGAISKLPEDTIRKMEWLGGPHYKALYAVWRARNGQG